MSAVFIELIRLALNYNGDCFSNFIGLIRKAKPVTFVPVFAMWSSQFAVRCGRMQTLVPAHKQAARNVVGYYFTLYSQP